MTQSSVWKSAMPVLYAALGHKVTPAKEFTDYVKALKSLVKIFDNHLNGKHFLVGETLTLADVVASTAFVVPCQTVLDAGVRKGMPHFAAWFERCMSLPSFVRRLGYIKPIEKAMGAFDPAAKPKAAPAAKAAPAKETKPADDDDLDLFGSDDDDEEAIENARQAAIDAKAKKIYKESSDCPIIGHV
jgi:hypothetical protein